VNVTSPYLNHPLGIGYLALLLALGEKKKTGALPATVTVPKPALTQLRPDKVAVAVAERLT
jgi:hypothetical protein